MPKGACFGNGLGNLRMVVPKIHEDRLLKMRSRPMMTMTADACDAASMRRMTTRSIVRPARNDKTSVRPKASQ
jgi:hypothetical protein